MRRLAVVAAILGMALTSLPSPAHAALNPAELKNRMRGIQRALDGLAGRLDRAEAVLGEASKAIARHRRLLDRSRSLRTQLSEAIGRRSRVLYQMGSGARFQALFTSEDLSVALDRLTYLDIVDRGQRRMLEGISTLRHEAKEARVALDGELTRARTARRELTDRRAELARRLREYRQYYSWMTAGRTVLRASRQGPRGFACPVPGGTAFGNSYGDRRPGGPHTGIDLSGNTGDRLVAVLPGRIVGTPSGGWIGLGVVLRDLGGDEWLYAHLSSRNVHVGQRVVAGEVIARMGCSGSCWGSHLHFEWHPGGGGPRNPYTILRSAC